MQVYREIYEKVISRLKMLERIARDMSRKYHEANQITTSTYYQGKATAYKEIRLWLTVILEPIDRDLLEELRRKGLIEEGENATA